MINVNDAFNAGPQAVAELLSRLPTDLSIDDMDIKRLADSCWTRASTLSKTRVGDARLWALSALAGYEFLQQHGNPGAARSAGENVAALRSWQLLREETQSAVNKPS